MDVVDDLLTDVHRGAVVLECALHGLDGTLDARVGAKSKRVKKGDVIHVPRGKGWQLTVSKGSAARYAGVRSAKWLTRIEVRDAPSDAPIQSHDYKLFPADVTSDTVDWSQGLTINAMPLNAAICSPGDGESLAAGEVRIEFDGKRMRHVESMRSCVRMLQQRGFHGFGHPSDDNGILLFQPERIVVEGVIAEIPRPQHDR